MFKSSWNQRTLFTKLHMKEDMPLGVVIQVEALFIAMM